MGQESMDVKGPLLGKLAEVGFMACLHGDFDDAQAIFEGIHAFREDNVDVLLGVAITKINAGKHADAIEILRDQVLKADPDNGTAQCFLGLALKRSGQSSDGEQILRMVAAAEGDARDLANGFLKSA